jgi:LAGLIDADG endonuclease
MRTRTPWKFKNRKRRLDLNSAWIFDFTQADGGFHVGLSSATLKRKREVQRKDYLTQKGEKEALLQIQNLFCHLPMNQDKYIHIAGKCHQREDPYHFDMGHYDSLLNVVDSFCCYPCYGTKRIKFQRWSYFVLNRN